MFDYEKLWKLLKARGIKKNDLKTSIGITPSTLAKLNKNENVSMEVLNRLCDFLECDIGDIVEHVYTPYKIDENLGTFAPNKKEAIHNWYSYLEGYSSSLVETELNRLNGISSILDPFAGSGTTPLVGVLNGLTSYYCETNPVMSFVTRVKTDSAFKVAFNDNKRRTLEKNIESIVKYLRTLNYEPREAQCYGGFEKYFDDINIFYAEEYKKYIDLKIEDQDIKDIFRIALAGIAVSISKMIRRGDLRYAKGKELLKTNKSFIEEIEKKLNRIYSDINNIEKKRIGKSLFLSDDCRDIKHENIVDAVITSPPYLNGTNYARNTKLELKLLDFIKDEKEVPLLHRKGIVSGINNVVSSDNEVEMIPSIEAIIEDLDRISYDSRIQKMIISYFNDMNIVFKTLSKTLKDGGYLIMDIGDSQFAGVHVPTHDVLIKLANNHGFHLYENEVIRSRKSKNGFNLTQRILRFRIKKKMLRKSSYKNAAENFLKKKSYQNKGRNWGHSWHSLCSYRGKLKPAIASELVKNFTNEGEIILDPMGGVGTIPFEACLQNRIGISNDLSELAHIVTKAKLEKPEYSDVLVKVSELENYIISNKDKYTYNKEVREFGLNKKIIDYFHPETMKEILSARQFFIESEHTNVDCLVEACLLHILHGNRPYALSRTSHPLTPYAPRGDFIYKNLIDHLVDKINRSYSSKDSLNWLRGKSYNYDIKDLESHLDKKADVIITSPPFASSFKFYTQNWMRLWFVGWTPEKFKTADDNFYDNKQNRNMDIYFDYFERCSNLLKKDGRLILHVGKSTNCDMSKELIDRCGQWFYLVTKGDELFVGENHGIVDKGATTAHQFIFLIKK